MSHFSCLVAAENEQELTKKLLPFHEYECTGIKEYTEFVPADMEELLKDFSEHGKGETLEEFAKDWNGYEKNSDGVFGRLTNPNKQWDWWEVGGRWEGRLKLLSKQSVSWARNGDIDWSGMRARINDDKMKQYRLYHKILEAHKDDVVPEVSTVEEAEKCDPNTVTRIIRYQDMVSRQIGFEKVWPTFKDYVIFCNAQGEFEKAFGFMWGNVDSLLELSLPEEEYQKRIDDTPTWAYIDNEGKWVEKGDMGWFGMSSKDEHHVGYRERFWSWINSLPEETTIFIVDCHI